MTLLLGLAALGIILWFINGFVKANPRGLAIGMKAAGGIALLALAGVLMLRGEIAVAVPLGVTGLGLLGWVPWSAASPGARARKSPGRQSHVRTAFIEMSLDHDSGAMTGRVVAGRYQGRDLDTLDRTALVGLLGSVDDDSRALLSAYLDRRFAGWREHADGGAAAGQGHAPGSGKMTEQEAQQILGVAPGASAEDIARAHRSLMKKLHPDQGGTTYLAARVNEAKDVLLRRHQR